MPLARDECATQKIFLFMHAQKMWHFNLYYYVTHLCSIITLFIKIICSEKKKLMKV